MRLLLAAVRCEKGDIDGNLAAHLAVVERAAAAGCDLVLFPELSLTGSVDPLRRPGGTVDLDHPAVAAMVEGTHHTGAVFGVAERVAGAAHITQVHAHFGEVCGVHRKRHLGADEDAYRPGTEVVVDEVGAVRFGVAICAEVHVDAAWDELAATAVPLVLVAAAPGLTDRCLDEEGWRAGTAWWEGAGLGDVRRHARRHGLWIAMATQAGATMDEDFPGIAALVDPSGEVVARLPDGRAGELVVDIPLEVTVEPVREAARALILDEQGRALLLRYEQQDGATTWWAAPGGGLDAGEDHAAAIRRELGEELQRDDLELGPWIGRREVTFRWQGRWLTQRERWLLCRARTFEVDPVHVATLVAENVHGMRWWSADELRAAGATTAPRRLPDLLDEITAGRIPAADHDLGR